MYKCAHFAIHELVPQHVYEDRGELAWELMDDRLCILIDFIRSEFGSTTINNWWWGGNRQWSGLRTQESPDYRPYSQHTFGRAVDAKFKSHTAEEVRQSILADPGKFPYLRAIELDVNWLHIDVRNCNPIKKFKP